MEYPDKNVLTGILFKTPLATEPDLPPELTHFQS